jgi:glutamate N-acetyltransferase/amino-acid N-acetyltransferase
MAILPADMADLHLLSPRGFRASAVYAGIKSRNVPDVALLVCPRGASAAAAFTTNQVYAAPVAVGREHVRNGKLCGVVVNAGNANACTGEQGIADARRMCEIAASVTGCKSGDILPSSTGIIGHLLPMDRLERGIVEAGQYLGESLEHANLFADAILTTDTVRKTAAVQLTLGRQRITIAGVCKGSGMIGPRLSIFDAATKVVTPRARSASGHAPGRRSGTGRAKSKRGSGHAARSPRKAKHATMLAYLTTDAAIGAPVLRKLLNQSSDVSFNTVTVDDHASTNDTAAILASGAGSRVSGTADLKKFAEALDEVCKSLAYQIARDGEGATKVVVITVRRAVSDAAARAMARTIANSPLVKCAMHGNDPNWGRIVSAAGNAGVPFDPDKCTLTLQGAQVFASGQPIAFDAAAVSESLRADEVRVELDCASGSGEATCWTCDLSKDYITINADYHT